MAARVGFGWGSSFSGATCAFTARALSTGAFSAALSSVLSAAVLSAGASVLPAAAFRKAAELAFLEVESFAGSAVESGAVVATLIVSDGVAVCLWECFLRVGVAAVVGVAWTPLRRVVWVAALCGFLLTTGFASWLATDFGFDFVCEWSLGATAVLWAPGCVVVLAGSVAGRESTTDSARRAGMIAFERIDKIKIKFWRRGTPEHFLG